MQNTGKPEKADGTEVRLTDEDSGRNPPDDPRPGSIVDVVGAHVALKRAGKAWKGLCPFHTEKTPSFSVNEERGTYKCFGCGKGGNAFTFLMETEGRTFREAAKLSGLQRGHSAAPGGGERSRPRGAARTRGGVRDAGTGRAILPPPVHRRAGGGGGPGVRRKARHRRRRRRKRFRWAAPPGLGQSGPVAGKAGWIWFSPNGPGSSPNANRAAIMIVSETV